MGRPPSLALTRRARIARRQFPSAVVVATMKGRGSAPPLAKLVLQQAMSEDTFVSLRAYPFDLPLYARAPSDTGGV